MDNLNWAAVIPCRYLLATDISSTQKLLIGLISGLSNVKGYCFASNEYLGNCLNISKVSVSHAVSDLEKKGYFGRVIYRNDKQQIEQRILVLILDKKNDIPIVENIDTLYPKNDIPIVENLKDNIKINRKINNNNIKTDFFYISEEWKELWEQWTEYKKEEHKDKFKSQKSEQLALNNLVKISKERIEVARKIVSLSIINRWKGLFEIKEEEQKKNKLEVYIDKFEEAKRYINERNNRSQEDNEVKRLSL
jgi:hypothetical protein